MKKAFLAIILIVITLSCAGKKKTSEIEKKTYETEKTNIVSDSVSEKEKETSVIDKKNEISTKTETFISYKPKVDSTGKFIPFKYKSIQDGKPQSIEVNGNGEVFIHTTEDNLFSYSEKFEKDLETISNKFKAEILSSRNEIISLNERIKESSQSIIRLYVIIFVLAVLLGISVYLHFKK